MSGIFVVAAKRTPFGAFGGSLKAISATNLGVAATKAALEQGKIDPATIDVVYFGNVIQSSPDAAYLARHVGLQSGIPIPTPALTINRLCGSGFETIILGANAIRLGDAKIALCGGTENMSAAPLQVSGNDARWGVNLGSGLNMRDALWDGLTDSLSNTPMGMTAENLAEKYNITRQVSVHEIKMCLFCVCEQTATMVV
jgi:acetyl-CoA acyltransferase 2